MRSKHLSQGFSLVEVVLAAAIFMLFSTSAIVVVLGGLNANRLGGEETVANQFANEGIEAVKSIKNQAYASLVNSAGIGVARPSNVWVFSGASNTLTHNVSDNYTRVIKVESVNRDGSGNIVSTGGTTDPDTKKITSTVSWNFNSSRPESVILSTYLSDWRKQIAPSRDGILVYGNGGTTSDAIQYKILDGTAGTWNSAASTADIDTGSTNRALRAARLYASSTRNEKILVSRHYNGSTQYIYAQVFNGTTWGNVQLLSSWAETNFLDVRNFDGAYLANGNFIAVYRDGTTTVPKYRIWDGSSWLAQADAANVGGIPNYIVTRARQGTNEVMLVIYDQGNNTNTAYFNGTNWSAATEHAAAGPTATKEHVDFAWSPQNSLKGALVYPSVGTDTTVNLKVWTANGSGGGSWSGTVDSAASGGRLGSIAIDGRKGAEEWLSCQKDASNDIYCFRADSAPAWATPANKILTTTSDTGIQRSFDLAYETTSGTEAIAVYSNNNPTPVYRLYTVSSNSFGAQTNLTTALGSRLETVRTRALSENDEIMIVMADTNQDLYTIVWDGASNAVYTSGGKSRTIHGLSGSTDTDFWFDYAWDRF